ncbi:hypothetical protein LEMLEM_LOCUS11728, partial [Lemmus lemmus]
TSLPLHGGDCCLVGSISGRWFVNWVDQGEKTHPKCGRSHFVGCSTESNAKAKVRQALVFFALCFLIAEAMGPAASSCCLSAQHDKLHSLELRAGIKPSFSCLHRVCLVFVVIVWGYVVVVAFVSSCYCKENSNNYNLFPAKPPPRGWETRRSGLLGQQGLKKTQCLLRGQTCKPCTEGMRKVSWCPWRPVSVSHTRGDPGTHGSLCRLS